MATSLTAAEEAADTVRRELWGARPLPVDPVQIARRLGVRVQVARLGSISGEIEKRRDADAVISINFDEAPTRQRFTCAHELGHYIKRTEENPDDDFEFRDNRDAMSSAGTDEDEIYANRFAAALLMPEREVRTQHTQRTPLWLMAKQFGVSTEAMGHRLKTLGLRAS